VTGTLEVVERDFGGSVGVDEVETLMSDIRPEEDARVSLELDLSKCRQVEIGAGFRLGNALQRWSPRALIVDVPEPGSFSETWFLTFTRSGLGLALSSSGARVRAGGSDVSDRVRRYYEEKGAFSASNYGICVNIDSGGFTPSIDEFGGLFGSLARQVAFEEADVEPPERRALVQVAYEAVRNVVDHAFKSLDTSQEAPVRLSYFSLRRYRTLGAASATNGRLVEYSERAEDRARSDQQQIEAWLELVVSDNGIGIAARHSQQPEIYRASIEAEDDALRAALEAGGSIKLRTNDAQIQGDPGFGLSIIAGGLRRLGGYAAVRTGRRLVALDATVDGSFAISEPVLGWMPGTVLQVVLPLRSRQLRFE
jgi:hypothetical protein